MDIKESALAADRLLNDDVFKEAVSELRKGALEALISVPATDTDAIRDKQALVRALDSLEGKLRAVITASKLPKRNAAA
ncbi:hypothetical protein RWA06_04590 [Sinorhizobium meliloti]|uniref:hypothetical protein n=1 Tax=Rhizobium meliloti TaxID=382 RepID=UPI00299E7CC9|nr:hypothetical protein [Sinorhizobium meliloti]MDX1222702.1 hypothetical protein [Sinorhizobium medicae]